MNHAAVCVNRDDLSLSPARLGVWSFRTCFTICIGPKTTETDVSWVENGCSAKLDKLKGAMGVCRCTDCCLSFGKSGGSSSVQTLWKRSKQTVLLPKYTLNVRRLNKLWNWGTKQLVLGENIQLIWLFSGGQRRHTSVLLSESCGALTVGSFIMQDVLIITHHHVFRVTWWTADSRIYKPLHIHTKLQKLLETTSKWIYSCVRNPHTANLKKRVY